MRVRIGSGSIVGAGVVVAAVVQSWMNRQMGFGFEAATCGLHGGFAVNYYEQH